MFKVKQDGKTKVFATLRANTPSARVPKSERITLKETIKRAKNARRNARLVNMF